MKAKNRAKSLYRVRSPMSYKFLVKDKVFQLLFPSLYLHKKCKTYMKTKRHKKGCYSIYLQQPSDYIISIKKELF